MSFLFITAGTMQSFNAENDPRQVIRYHRKVFWGEKDMTPMSLTPVNRFHRDDKRSKVEQMYDRAQAKCKTAQNMQDVLRLVALNIKSFLESSGRSNRLDNTLRTVLKELESLKVCRRIFNSK